MMDIEKLIERYRNLANRWENGEQLLLDGTMRIQDELRDAAIALATMKEYCNSVCRHLNEADAINRKLQTENEKLRADLEQKSNLIAQQAAEMERRDTLLKKQEAELEQLREMDGVNALWVHNLITTEGDERGADVDCRHRGPEGEGNA